MREMSTWLCDVDKEMLFSEKESRHKRKEPASPNHRLFCSAHREGQNDKGIPYRLLIQLSVYLQFSNLVRSAESLP